MTHFFFDAGVFLSNFWASNTLSAQGVPAPVPPQPVPAGGGAASIWPAWRVKQKMDRACDDFVREIARKYCPDPDDKPKKINPYPMHLEGLLKKEVPVKDYSDKKKIESLKKRITVLEERLREVKKKAKDKKKDAKVRMKAARRMERLGLRVRSLLNRLQSMYNRMEEKEAELKRHEAILTQKEKEIDRKLAELKEAPAQAPSDPRLEALKLVLDERRRVLAGVMAAVPWAAGSVAVYLGTEYLVPEDERVLRFLGYAASGALAVTALVQGYSVYQDWDRTAADRG